MDCGAAINFEYSQRLRHTHCYGWLLSWGRHRRKQEIGCFKTDCCKVCIVSFPLTLRIALVTFWYTPIRGIEYYASLLVQLLTTRTDVSFMSLKIWPLVSHRVGHRVGHGLHHGLGHGLPHVLSTPLKSCIWRLFFILSHHMATWGFFFILNPSGSPFVVPWKWENIQK